VGGVTRNVQIVLLCEDTQHEAFARRFLNRVGWSTRRLRVERAPGGRGSAEQFVRDRFPNELAEYRRRPHVTQALIVIVDGDNRSVVGRRAELDEACRESAVQVCRPGERVLVLVPTWNVETWIAYLDGQTVDEMRPDYPRLQRPRQCQQHVDALAAMCRGDGLRAPAPPSLEAACAEYQRLPANG